jgi:hypothetical protein
MRFCIVNLIHELCQIQEVIENLLMSGWRIALKPLFQMACSEDQKLKGIDWARNDRVIPACAD